MFKSLTFLIMFCSIGYSQWEIRTNGLPSWNVCNLIKVSNDSTITAVVHTGSRPYPINISTDSGINWISKSTPDQSDVSDIAILDKNNFWFAEINGKIYRTTDGGDSWTLQFNDNVSVPFFDFIEIFGGNNLIAIGDAPAKDKPVPVLISTDAGEHWTNVNHSYLIGEASGDQFFRFSFPNFNTGYFYGSLSKKLYKTIDSGASWTDIPFPGSGVFVVKFYDDNLGLIINGQQNTCRTTNGGSTWQQLNLQLNPNSVHHDIEFVPGDPSKIWITDFFQLFFSADTGNTWQLADLGDSDLRGRNIEFINSDFGILLCDENKIYVTTNGGITSAVNDKSNLPLDFVLYQNYPNPFNPETTINYTIPEVETTRRVVFTTLKVYDTLGNEIATIINRYLPPGNYSEKFNAERFNLPSGIYFYRLQAGYSSIVRKIILLK